MYTDSIKQCILQIPILYKEFNMPKFIDRTGQRFGKLIVLEESGRNNLKKVLWKCKCDCGKETIVPSGCLVTKNTSSCGCVIPNFKHGGYKNSSYNSWKSMINRCTNPKSKDYIRYGAKGISVYPAWMDYVVFKDFMGEPVGKETLDRIDPFGNYEPNNVRWASPTTQARNIRLPKTSKTGFTGVLFHNNKYYASITVKKKKYYSKVFSTVQEAAEARKELECIYWNNR